MRRMFAILFLATLIGEATASAQQPAAAKASFETIKLKDIHRRTRTLADYKDKRALAIIFTGTECPLANLYVPTLVQLHEEFKSSGVQFLLVNSNSQDSFLEFSGHAQERNIPFPSLKDFDHALADALGAKRTPEAFVLDGKRNVVYSGQIDDQNEVGVRKKSPTRRYMRIAIEAVLAGNPVAVSRTEPSGCMIGRADKPRLKERVTFAKDVAPIMQNRCQECHREGEIGPMALASYDDAKGWKDTIREVVLEERMPPWHADPRYGKFLNDRSLSRAERDTLIAWVEQGCEKGNDADLPAPKTFPDGWKIGKPDAVFTMPKPFDVPATGVIDYQRFTVQTGFTEDRWIAAAETRPGNRAVVHHILVYILEPGRRQPYDRDGTTTSISGWAPGDMPTIYRPGIAKRLPANSRLLFEVHYTPNGTAQSDQSSIGLVFAKEKPELAAETNILANMAFNIPAGEPNYRGQMTYTFRDDALVLSVLPHMHLRGTSARYVLTYPDGKSETVLSVPDFDFGWQSLYRFREPLQIPKGTRLVWTGTWDNSADNPRNPDHTKSVRFGLQTWDEMQNGWMEMVRLVKPPAGTAQ